MRHRAQLEQLAADPGLADNAVSECLRFDSPVQHNYRTVLEPVELGGTELQAREMVITLLGAANRDPEQFPDPDILDVRRGAISPIAFGAGMRFCIGAPLAGSREGSR